MRLLKAGNRLILPGGRALRSVTGSAPSFPAVTPIWYLKADGNVNDSVGSNHGTNVGAVSYPGGKINQAIKYTAPNNYTTFSPLGITGNQPWTFCTWLKINNSGVNCVIGFGNESHDQAMFGYIDNGIVKFDWYGSGPLLASATSVNSNTWRHVAFKYDGADMYIYVDGLPDAGPYTYAPNLADVYFWIANVYSGSGGVTMNGLMDESYFFDSPISNSDILGIKNAGDAGVLYN